MTGTTIIFFSNNTRDKGNSRKYTTHKKLKDFNNRRESLHVEILHFDGREDDRRLSGKLKLIFEKIKTNFQSDQFKKYN